MLTAHKVHKSCIATLSTHNLYILVFPMYIVVLCMVFTLYLLHIMLKLAVDQELLQDSLLMRQNSLKSDCLLLNLLQIYTTSSHTYSIAHCALHTLQCTYMYFHSLCVYIHVHTPTSHETCTCSLERRKAMLCLVGSFRFR